MTLPSSLHSDAFAVVEGQGRDEVIRQFAVIFQLTGLHIPFHDRRIDFVVHVRPVEGFGFSFVEIGVNRFNPAGNAEHSRQCSRRRDGEQLGIAQAVFLYLFGRCIRRIGFKIRCAHDFIDMTFSKGTAFVCQICRSGNGRIRHGKADIMAEINGILTAIGQSHLNKHVTKTHDTEADLAPSRNAFPLFFQGMEREAFFKNVI